MNRERSNHWGTYARELANKLELRDWTVTVCRRYADEPFAGQAECIYGRKSIDISLALGFDNWSPEKQRQTITHELIHAHTARSRHLIAQAREHVSKYWVNLLEAEIKQDIEYATDAMADAVSKYLPLPPDDTKRKKKRKKVKA